MLAQLRCFQKMQTFRSLVLWRRLECIEHKDKHLQSSKESLQSDKKEIASLPKM